MLGFSYFYGMSKDEQIALLKAENIQLKSELEQLKKLVFGTKRERFVPQVVAGQGSLFDVEETPQPEAKKETITYERKKPTKKHPGRNAIPDHLPVEEVIIEPEEDTTGMQKIGEERTETLKYTPASLVKLVTIRPKYVHKAEGQDDRIVMASPPARPIPKGLAEASLIAYILVSKFVDHLPFYRQQKRFKRTFGWDVPDSTLNSWFAAVSELLKPLYEAMKKELLIQHYIQADESPMKVLDADKKGSTHRGYQWVYYSPAKKLVLFNYRKGRGMHGPKEMLANYEGFLQCDGYTVYDKIGQKPAITLVGCAAHVRRKFYEAKDSDVDRAAYALSIFKQIYTHERSWKDKTPEQRKELRQKQVKPLLEELKTWVDDESLKVLPKSPIGKAMRYILNQWPKLQNVLEDGRLEIDNNLIENKIRPLALGRKNYLFAGSHKGAERIAMMYSFFGTCAAHDVNPYDWLKTVLEQIPTIPINQIHTLFPGNVKM